MSRFLRFKIRSHLLTTFAIIKNTPQCNGILESAQTTFSLWRHSIYPDIWSTEPTRANINKHPDSEPAPFSGVKPKVGVSSWIASVLTTLPYTDRNLHDPRSRSACQERTTNDPWQNAVIQMPPSHGAHVQTFRNSQIIGQFFLIHLWFVFCQHDQ